MFGISDHNASQTIEVDIGGGNIDGNEYLSTITVTYRRMAYGDWVHFYERSARLEESGSRYILSTYVEAVKVKQPGLPPETIDITLLLREKPGVVAGIIDAIHENSSYSDTRRIEKELLRLKDREDSLDFIIDAFFFYHLPLNEYISLVDTDFDTRMLVLSHLQRKVGVDILERLRIAREKKSDSLDIVTPNKIYFDMLANAADEKKIFEGKKTLYSRHARQPDQQTGTMDTIQQILEETRKVHERNMDYARQHPSKNFDYHADEASLSQAEKQDLEQI